MKGLPPPKPNTFDQLKQMDDPAEPDEGSTCEEKRRRALRVQLMQAVAAATYEDTKALILEGIQAYNRDQPIDEEWLNAVLGVFEL